jgi:hypothetical protein
MARKRQARRCTARRTDGDPCEAFAILGGTVCAAHGGSAPRVRMHGLLRYWEKRTTRAYDGAYVRWKRELLDWQVRRLVAAANILGVDVADVHPGDLLCLAVEGRIAGEDTAPKLRVDRRYGPRAPAQLATRAARQAARKEAGSTGRTPKRATAPDAA